MNSAISRQTCFTLMGLIFFANMLASQVSADDIDYDEENPDEIQTNILQRMNIRDDGYSDSVDDCQHCRPAKMKTYKYEIGKCRKHMTFLGELSAREQLRKRGRINAEISYPIHAKRIRKFNCGRLVISVSAGAKRPKLVKCERDCGMFKLGIELRGITRYSYKISYYKCKRN